MLRYSMVFVATLSFTEAQFFTIKLTNLRKIGKFSYNVLDKVGVVSRRGRGGEKEPKFLHNDPQMTFRT